MSKLNEANEKIAQGIAEGYQKIEDGVVGGYKKIENGVVEGFGKITDKFVGTFLTRDGESVEDAKARVAQEQKAREEKMKARIDASLDASQNADKHNEAPQE